MHALRVNTFYLPAAILFKALTVSIVCLLRQHTPNHYYFYINVTDLRLRPRNLRSRFGTVDWLIQIAVH